MAISVAVPVTEEAANRLMEKLVPRVESLKIGPPPRSTPILARSSRPGAGAREGLCRHRREGRRQARRRRPRLQDAGLRERLLHGRLSLRQRHKDMRIYKEEIFGPVLSVVRAKTYGEALDLANDHEYGNGVAIFTRDGDAARDFAARCRSAVIQAAWSASVPIPGRWPTTRSAAGSARLRRPEPARPDAFRFYTKTKTVTSRWPRASRTARASSSDHGLTVSGHSHDRTTPPRTLAAAFSIRRLPPTFWRRAGSLRETSVRRHQGDAQETGERTNSPS